ncbi:hypothetical protein QYE76_037916 [Lolium multiflorum]|uniref:Retrotransposon gag domain-containing protein n=1 Tax=Lolium multiflorum TaxID=4521 RepID=A0AAD8T7W0_LOLMU|nr:hypothetical protein QYE76_037916 [Lolium multiflorum]
MKSGLDPLQGLVRSYSNNRYEEGASIARGGEEQLDVKLDVELDMKLDMKTSHGRAREEREACARKKMKSGAQARSDRTPRRRARSPAWSTGRHAGQPGADRILRHGTPGNIQGLWTPSPVTTRCQGPVSTGLTRSRPGRPAGDADSVSSRPDPRSGDEKIVNQKNKDAADVMTWREYEALRNEMRREFRDQDEELKGTVEEVAKKLDTTNQAVNAMQDQMMDIQRNIQALTLAIENLTQQQQHHEDEDAELQDEARGAGRGVGRGNRGRGVVELGARRVPPQPQDDGLGKPKFSIPKFEGGADVEEYLTWELKIEKLWCLHDYTEDRKVKLASSEFDGYALRWWDGVTRARQEDEELPHRTWREMKAIMQARYEEGASIARGGEEQLDVKLDMELDMKLDMKTSHGRGQEAGACARKKAVSGAGRSPGLPRARSPGPAGPPRRASRRRPVSAMAQGSIRAGQPGHHPLPGPVSR